MSAIRLHRIGPFRTGNRHLVRVAIALCIAILAGFVLTYLMLLQAGQAGPARTDFLPYFSAAHLVAGGHGASIYDPKIMGAFERHLVRPLTVKDGVMPYLYPPAFALALAPLAALSYSWAFLVWTAFNSALLLVSISLLARYARLAGASRLLYWCAALSFLPCLVGLAQGQTASLLLAAMTGTFLCMRVNKDVAAGLLLAGIIIKLPYLLPVLLVLALRRRWTVIGACAAACGILFAIPMLLLGVGIGHGYVDTLWQALGWRHQIGGFAPRWNQSIAGFTELLLPGDYARSLQFVLSGLTLGLLALLSLRSPSLERPFALAIVAGLLVAPHVLIHDLTLLVLPATLAYTVLAEVGERSLQIVLICGYLACIAALPLVAVVPVQLSVIAMGALGLWLSAPDIGATVLRLHRFPAGNPSGPSAHLPSIHSLPMKD